MSSNTFPHLAWMCAALLLGSMHAAAQENIATEPGMPWPVISEAEAAQILSSGGQTSAQEHSSVTSTAIPWPVISDAEALALKAAHGERSDGSTLVSVTEPGMPWPVVSEDEARRAAASPSSDTKASVAAQEVATSSEEASVTEPGLPWPVVTDAEVARGDREVASTSSEVAASEGVRPSVTEPGMPWPVVESMPIQDAAPSAGVATVQGPNPTAEARACGAEVERVAGLSPIGFRNARTGVTEGSLEHLNRIAAAIRGCSGIRVIISGHTDSLGPADINLKLSRARATAVAAYFVKHGVDSRFLVTEGYGADRPIASNKTAADRAKNRRIEFKVETLAAETQ